MTTPANQSSPLAGRTVVIVEPEKLSEPVLKELDGCGARVLTCPPIEIAELGSYEQLDEALDHLYGYDWLLFTSVSAVEAFLRRLQHKGFESSALDELRVCALGADTEKLLREEQVHVDVASAIADTRTLFDALESFVGGRPALTGLNVLSPRAAVVGDSLTRALTGAGARVDLVPAYRVKPAPGMDPGRMAAMFSAAADYIVLGGSASVSHLSRLFDTLDLGAVLADVSIGCFDEATAKAAQDHGLDSRILPTRSAVKAIAKEVVG